MKSLGKCYKTQTPANRQKRTMSHTHTSRVTSCIKIVGYIMDPPPDLNWGAGSYKELPNTCTKLKVHKVWVHNQTLTDPYKGSNIIVCTSGRSCTSLRKMSFLKQKNGIFASRRYFLRFS